MPITCQEQPSRAWHLARLRKGQRQKRQITPPYPKILSRGKIKNGIFNKKSSAISTFCVNDNGGHFVKDTTSPNEKNKGRFDI